MELSEPPAATEMRFRSDGGQKRRGATTTSLVNVGDELPMTERPRVQHVWSK
ncbi:unnamed protein product [Strongylus vulgaris]|uniref:Uncharacterized protein n=1 Tax=Strongylus vulgaris TaxID=40348 RepID=A0A3P7JWH4_STRVU|nr:unnamed protein product [Strongylus vulgaris]